MKSKIMVVAVVALLMVNLVAFSQALTYSRDFSTDDEENFVVVVGEGASQSDYNVANDIVRDLLGDFEENSSTDFNQDESFKIERSSNFLNLGESLSDIEPGEIGSDDLSILEDQTYNDDSGENYDYEQSVELADNLVLQWFETDVFDGDEPVIGLDLQRGTPLLNYTLDFDESVNSEIDGGNLVDLEDTEISILGNEYTIVSASDSPLRLEMLGGAITDTLRIDETGTYNLDGRNVQVEISFVDDDEAVFLVDGESTGSLEEGESITVADGVRIGVTSINFQNFAGGIQQVKFVLGAKEIVFEDGQEVEVNGDKVDDLVSHIESSEVSDEELEIDQIVLSWTPDDDKVLSEDNPVVMPEFGALALVMTGFVTPAQEEFSLDIDGDEAITADVFVEDGEYNALPLLFGDGTNFTGIGRDSDELLATSTNGTLTVNPDNDDLFIASWSDGDDAESYILQVTDINEDNGDTSVTVENQVSGDEDENEIGDTIDFGNVALTIQSADEDANTVTFSINSGGSFNRLYTQEGLTLILPVEDSGEMGGIGIGEDSSYTLQFLEENDNEDKAAGESINISASWSGGELDLDGTSGIDTNLSGDGFIEEGNSDNFVGYVESPLATRIEVDENGDSNSILLVYHGEESYGEIYLASGTGVSEGRSPSDWIVTPDEVSGSEDRNMIVIGGSCVNSLSADLLGIPYPSCGSQWERYTGVGPGEFLIESFGSDRNMTSIVIAGYDATDTVNAGNYLRTQEPTIDFGARYIGTTGTNAVLV